MHRKTLFLAVTASLALAGAFAYAMAPLRAWSKDQSVDQFLQRHYKQMSQDELAVMDGGKCILSA